MNSSLCMYGYVLYVCVFNSVFVNVFMCVLCGHHGVLAELMAAHYLEILLYSLETS